jgi:SMODS-associated and fused to various effectors sensor domain
MTKKPARKKIPGAERLKLWVRSGGRCTICNKYLLEGKLSSREVTFGELAHIVGQAKTKGSPRGLDTLPLPERDKAENLMLICADDHDEIDNKDVVDLFQPDKLRKLKQEHESRIFHVTGLAGERRTTIIRMVGNIGDNPVELRREIATDAVSHSANRFPDWHLASDHKSIEIDLGGLPGEATGTALYYEAAKQVIDRVVKDRLKVGIAREVINHLSVFAFARLPLLVYLGSCLDDNIKTDVYQRHRTPEDWAWPMSGATKEFKIIEPKRNPSEHDAVVLMNISGTVQTSRIPTQVEKCSRFIVDIENAEPSSDAINTAETLASFENTCRQLFVAIEARHPHFERVHLFGALPASAAVVLGRVHNPAVHPKLLTYHLADNLYSRAIEIG